MTTDQQVRLEDLVRNMKKGGLSSLNSRAKTIYPEWLDQPTFVGFRRAMDRIMGY